MISRFQSEKGLAAESDPLPAGKPGVFRVSVFRG
jgi:hypothetical protein